MLETVGQFGLQYNVSSSDRWSVGEDHTGVRGYAASIRPES